MNAGKAVYGILSGTTAVTDIVGTRIFPEIAEQEAVTPFVIYQLQSVAPEDTHDGPSKLDEVRFEFLCYADSYNEAADLGVAVRGALDRVSGTYNGVNVESVQFNDVDVEIEYDPRRYSQVLKFTFRIKRDDIEIALGTPVTGAQLGDLSDVNVDGVTDNQILSYDAATDTWVPAADAGGAETLDDLTDVDAGAPSSGQLLAYGQDTWETIAQDELTLPIGSVTGLQAELDTIPDSLDDLDDVKIIGTPSEGDALVYQSGFFSLGTAGASTLGDLDDVNTTGAGVGSLIQFNGSTWDISAAELPSDAVYYHNRYASEAETLLDGATATVELYYTAQADGDGLAESASSDTATTGYDIRRKLYYSEAAQADPDTGTWTQFADIADDTTFSSAKATLLAYLKERTGGTVPISLKMTWEEVAEAPAFTGLLNETYGSGAAAAYSVRRLNGNYTGAAIEVERSSDNSTQDIGFDSNGDLDESALTTFCTGTTCKVRTWYDQSVTGGTGSGNDAQQTDHTKQPTIYTGGAIVKRDGKVAILGNGSSNLQFTQIDFDSDLLFVSLYEVYISDTIVAGTSNNFLGAAVSSYTQIRSRHSDGVTQSTLNCLVGTALSPQQKILFGLNKTGTASNNVSFTLNGISKGASTSAIGTDSSIIGSVDGAYQEILLYDATKSSAEQTDIESNIGDYFTQNTPLLDTYTGAAAAYSLRKLRSAYSGSAIRVRRASDNTEQDIGFNVFGELDTVSLASFCSGTNGFLKTWYDQSGNANDATQTTAANQPKIYDSSTGVVTENGKPAVDFDGSNDTLRCASAFSEVAYISAVYENNETASFKTILGADATTTSYGSFYFQSSSATIRAGGFARKSATTPATNYEAVMSSAVATGTQILQTGYISGSTIAVAQNGTLSTASINTSDLTVIGGQQSGAAQIGAGYYNNNIVDYTASKIQEIVVYDSDNSSNRTGIESNINTFYSIY